MYTVEGYTMACQDYRYTFDNFIKAVKIYLKCLDIGDTVFIFGVSKKVSEKLNGLYGVELAFSKKYY